MTSSPENLKPNSTAPKRVENGLEPDSLSPNHEAERLEADRKSIQQVEEIRAQLRSPLKSDDGAAPPNVEPNPPVTGEQAIGRTALSEKSVAERAREKLVAEATQLAAESLPLLRASEFRPNFREPQNPFEAVALTGRLPVSFLRSDVGVSSNEVVPGRSQRGYLSLLGQSSSIIQDVLRSATPGDVQAVLPRAAASELDERGCVKSISYPGATKERVFSRDQVPPFAVNGFTTRDEKGERTYLKQGNKWFLDVDGGKVPIPGRIDVSAKGDVSFETTPGTWRTELADGSVLAEKSQANGARVALNSSGQVDRITRPDGSLVEAKYDENNQRVQLTEYNSSGSQKTISVRKGDHWETSAGKTYNSIEVYPNGVTVREGADRLKQITMGDGKLMNEAPGKASFTFDKLGRFETITYADKSSVQLKYVGDSTRPREVAKIADGKVAMVLTRDGDSNWWQIKDANDKRLGTFNGDYAISPTGDVRYKDNSTSKNPDGLWTVIRPDKSYYQEKLNSDGTKLVKNPDRSTVDIDSSGHVRRITKSKDDFRLVDWENGEISKITDYHKGRQTSSWQRARPPQEETRLNVTVSDAGEIGYKTSDGRSIMEKANLAKVQFATDGTLLRVTQLNGSHRDFFYDEINGRKEVSSITDTRHSSSGKDTVETLTARKNTDGSLSNSFSMVKEGKMVIRNDVVIGGDGDYQYRDSDGKIKTAKASRETGENGMSESVDEAKDVFRDAMSSLLEGPRKARMEVMMKEFEKRMSSRVEAAVASNQNQEKAQAEAEQVVAGTYDNLSQMLTNKVSNAFYNLSTRAKLVENFMFMAMDPGSMNQGGHGTCWAQAGIISGGLIPWSNHMARLVKEISLTGTYKALNHGEGKDKNPKTFKFSSNLLKMGGEESRWTIDQHAYKSGSRSPVGLIFDQVIPHFIRSEGNSSSGGWYEGNGGIRNMMYMVTGKIVEQRNISGTQDVSNDKKTLLEKGGFITYNPGHMRSRHLKKEGDHWVIVQDDQHGNGNDRVIYQINNLKAWDKRRVDRGVKRVALAQVGDKPVGGVVPHQSNQPSQPSRNQNNDNRNRRQATYSAAYSGDNSAPVVRPSEPSSFSYADAWSKESLEARRRSDDEQDARKKQALASNENEKPTPMLWRGGRFVKMG